MKHPSEATLALYAGRDLGWWARVRTRRHLSVCRRCRDEVAGFEAARAALTDLRDLPAGLSWNRLSAEMKANIRLGLEAGACVAAPEPRFSWFGARPLVAFASMAALVFASILLVERPAPRAAAVVPQGVVLQATSGGIEWNDGRQSMRLMHKRDEAVTYLVGAQGAMRARYVNSDGYVTINNVYAQ